MTSRRATRLTRRRRHKRYAKVSRKRRSPMKSFSPSINKKLPPLLSISPNASIFRCSNPQNVRTGSKDQCVLWTTERAQQILLRNLNSKKPINCANVIAPRQIHSNCWFNTLFMVLFVSDKARKFFRYLRVAMITGRHPGGTRIPNRLRWPFFLLNRYIEASLRGTKDRERFARLMDTNILIRKLHTTLASTASDQALPKTRQPFNPLSYYELLMQYLAGGDELRWGHYDNKQIDTVIALEKEMGRSNPSSVSQLVFLEYDAQDAKRRTVKQKFSVRIGRKTYKYQIDSAILRDIDGNHFSAYITCNKRYYRFDGFSFARMEPFNWPHYLNRDKSWRFIPGAAEELVFNFRKGYQILIYYRV